MTIDVSEKVNDYLVIRKIQILNSLASDSRAIFVYVYLVSGCIIKKSVRHPHGHPTPKLRL